jgi:hypothetical protein
MPKRFSSYTLLQIIFSLLAISYGRAARDKSLAHYFIMATFSLRHAMLTLVNYTPTECFAGRLKMLFFHAILTPRCRDAVWRRLNPFRSSRGPEGRMTITQTVDIPADHRVFFEFLAPREIPEGKAKVEVKVIPFVEKQTDQRSAKPVPKNADEATPIPDSLKHILSQPSPHTDALLGILSGLGDITLEQIRDERLAKHLK